MKIACFKLKSPARSSDFGSGRCFCAVLLCVFLLSGCDILKGLRLGGDEEDEGDEGDGRWSADPIPQEPVWNGVPVTGAENNPSIKAKFGVGLEGKAGVDAVFHQLKAFISNDGLDATPPMIRIGDWIDLEGGIEVAAYDGIDGAGGGNFIFSASDSMKNWGNGNRGRLIVVGINSFRSGEGVDGRYAVPENDGVDHVVFQFQNLPVKRRMNQTQTNAGGYAASEMRKYLVPVGDDNESGKFLAGLVAAGVPEDVLWAPTRYVANGGDANYADEINDLLWLPTEREMSGSQGKSSVTYETVANQAWLKYYSGSSQRRKNFSNNASSWYWGASPYASPADSFQAVTASGGVSYNGATLEGGCAPAFCVR